MTKGWLNDDFDVPGDITGGGIQSTPIGTTTSAAVTGTTGTFDDVDVDNVNINVNTISITDTNGNMLQKANGTGDWKVTTPGDADAIICDSDGAVTMPLQPAVLASNTSLVSNVTGDGTTYTIVFGTEITDAGGDYDGTSTYTNPVTGNVLIQAQQLLDDINNGVTHTYMVMTIVTSNRSYFPYIIAPTPDVNGEQGVHGSVTADMDAADTLTITVAVGGATKIVDAKALGFLSVNLLS